MNDIINKVKRFEANDNLVFIISSIDNLNKDILTDEEYNYVKKQIVLFKKDLVSVNKYDRWVFIQLINNEKTERNKLLEKTRIYGSTLVDLLNKNNIKKITLIDKYFETEIISAYIEGIYLGNYQFLKYKSKREKINTLEKILVFSDEISYDKIFELNNVLLSVCKCRDLINEPVMYLNAQIFSDEIVKMGEELNVKVEVFNKEKIKALKMGGLLAVNKGSIDPPTFTVFEWKPDNAVNKKPVVLVGKGVVFDTGGINIKTGNFLDGMKCDMSGAAVVACSLYAIAKAKLPVYVVGLMPCTDNRLNNNAYVPGDVITMHNGKTVEIVNTDAEGRMLLADALSYADKYNPEVVIDIATLTGAASRAIGKYGIVAMNSHADKEFDKLKQTSFFVNERLVEFPLWDEYDEAIKSDIADIKNLGGPDAGAIVACKFLEHFTDSPFIHLDIAGSAFLDKKYNYFTAGGTGVGVRLFYYYLKNFAYNN